MNEIFTDTFDRWTLVSTNETLGTGSNEFQQKGSENERQAR